MHIQQSDRKQLPQFDVFFFYTNDIIGRMAMMLLPLLILLLFKMPFVILFLLLLLAFIIYYICMYVCRRNCISNYLKFVYNLPHHAELVFYKRRLTKSKEQTQITITNFSFYSPSSYAYSVFSFLN